MTQEQQRVLWQMADAGGYWDRPWRNDAAAWQCVDKGWLQRDGHGYCLTHSGRGALGILHGSVRQ